MVNAKKLGLVGRIILAAGAAGSLAGCVGEEGGFINPYAVGGAGLKAAGGLSNNPGAGAAAYAVGEGVQATGQYRAAEDAARAGASNVYAGENQENNTNNSVIHATSIHAMESGDNSTIHATSIHAMKPSYDSGVSRFTGVPEVYFCNGFFDEDGNGIVSPKELKNIKTEFRNNEPLMAVSWWYNANNNLNGKEIVLEILCLDNEKSFESSTYKVNQPAEAVFPQGHSYSSREITDYLGGNHYKAIWKVNGTPAKFGEFTIE